MVIGNSQQTRIRIEGNTNANATWNSRSDKNMALILDYTVNGSQWGWTQVVRTIHAYQEGAGTSSCLRGLGQLTNSSTEYVYVRGGAKYNFYVSRFITPTLRTSTYTTSSQSVAPATSAPAAISRNVAYISDTVAAANKVTNTLTFTGYQSKSFNGSAAVSVAIPNNTNQLTNGAGFITSSASISGNAGSATKLQTARTINGTSFNGTANITTANWGTTRSIYIQDATATNTSSAVSVNGGGNAYLKLPTNIKVGTLTATGEVTAYSDIRLKTSIQPLENRGYIKPVTYKKDGKDSIGFIAQEVRELYPELVIEDNTEDKYLSVNYAQYVAVLQAQIIDLKKEIDELKNIKTK